MTVRLLYLLALVACTTPTDDAPPPGFHDEWTSGETTYPSPLPGPILYVGTPGVTTSMQCLLRSGAWQSFIWSDEGRFQFPEKPVRCEVGGARVRLRWYVPDHDDEAKH